MAVYQNFNRNPRCDEIWMCDLGNNGGSVQSGYRPVFIVSNDKNNTYSPTINIIPITSKMRKHKLPVHVELWQYEKYGLKVPSVLLVEQITTIGIECIDKYVGNVDDPKTLNSIKNAMRIQFPMISAI